MRVALRVEVGTLRGLREGVPNLLRLFDEYRLQASFFFPMGLDLSGLQPLQSWRGRRHLGLAAMGYGTFFPAPDLAKAARDAIHLAQQDAHDVGISCLSPLHWCRQLAHAEKDWVTQQLNQAFQCWEQQVGQPATVFASHGWQVHPSLLQAESVRNLRFASDVRGKHPFLPVLGDVTGTVVQIPTTLPTLAEIMKRPEVDATNVHEYLYSESCHLLPAGHVYTARAEHEGMEYIELMEKLMVMWKGQEGALRNLNNIYEELDLSILPRHQIGWGKVKGESGPMAMQSLESA